MYYWTIGKKGERTGRVLVTCVDGDGAHPDFYVGSGLFACISETLIEDAENHGYVVKTE